MVQERGKKVLTQLNSALEIYGRGGDCLQYGCAYVAWRSVSQRATDWVEAVKAIKKLASPGEQEQHCRQDRAFMCHPRIHQADDCGGGYSSGCGRFTPYQKYPGQYRLGGSKPGHRK